MRPHEDGTFRSVAASLLAALEAAVDLAKVTHAAWDSDQDMRVGKNLMALAGYNKKYRADCDTIHETIQMAKEVLATDCPICGEEHEGNVPLGCATGDGI